MHLCISQVSSHWYRKISCNISCSTTTWDGSKCMSPNLQPCTYRWVIRLVACTVILSSMSRCRSLWCTPFFLSTTLSVLFFHNLEISCLQWYHHILSICSSSVVPVPGFLWFCYVEKNKNLWMQHQIWSLKFMWFYMVLVKLDGFWCSTI